MSESTAFPVASAHLSRASTIAPKAPPAAYVVVLNLVGVPLLSRVIVLLATLFVVKLVLVAAQGQSLYETHWRFNGVPESWLNPAAFCLFVIFGGISVFRLLRSQAAYGTGAFRVCNFSIVLLGLLFVFLTFHNGNKNFLYPVFTGVLKWTSLVPYTANATFFIQPFLGAWIFVYVVAYYCIARIRREQSAAWLTVGMGCAYAFVNLRGLTVYRDELLIIDCFGALSLGMSWCLERLTTSHRKLLSTIWIGVPAGWTLFFGWTLMRFDNGWQNQAATYFLANSLFTIGLFAATSFFLREVWNAAAWSWFVPFFLCAFLLLTNTHYPASENYNHLLCLGLTFPRYFLGELVLVAMIAACAWGYLRIRPGAGLWWLDVAALGLLALVLLDLKLSQIMGVRLGWDILSFGDSPKMMFRMARPYLPGVIAGLIISGAVYMLTVRAVHGWAGRLKLAARAGNTRASFSTGTLGLAYGSSVFALLGLLGAGIAESDKVQGQAIARLIRTSPVWKRVATRSMSREEFLKSAKTLGLGDMSVNSPAVPVKPRRDLNLVVVFMESSYNKHLSLFGSSEQTQPLLTKYRDRMEVFPNFFSVFAGSIHARFATFTSLYPVSDFHAFTQERVPVKSLFDVLHDQGYSCSMFYSSYFDYTGFRDFLKNRGFDEMYDADTMPGQRSTERVEWGLLEEETLKAIRAQIQKRAADHRRFCLTYVPAAPHYPYDRIPKPFRKFSMKEVGDYTPLYLNELLYMDWVIASIVDELKDSGLLENTMVIITNDHGEMLGGKEDAHIGHGWAITPQLANTPLIVMDPARPGFQVNKTVGTQVDFLPTVLARLNIPLPADQLYEGQSLDAGDIRAGRRGYINSYKQFGIVEADKLLLGDRESNNPAGDASRGAVFNIVNEGSRTVFTECESSGAITDRLDAMARFDEFQENLLRNYEHYCSAVRAPARQLAKRVGP